MAFRENDSQKIPLADETMGRTTSGNQTEDKAPANNVVEEEPPTVYDADAPTIDERIASPNPNDSATLFAGDAPTVHHAETGSAVASSLESSKRLPYDIVEQIGSGGMGTVYLAKQKKPERMVALKLISFPSANAEFLSRFESEYQVLAMMNHPHIATVYDVGITPLGDPFFTMEYVPDNLNIAKYCGQRKLDLQGKLRLFLQVCDGVLHAHQNAVVHRDLKPANILVTDAHSNPIVKIIDFGVAKRLSSDHATSYQTREGNLIGTPAYMSPEQLTSVSNIDTRTDIYALGLILYELITGLPPFDPERFKDKPLDECLRIYREEDLPLPSRRLARSNKKNAASLRGDLDAIVSKATARNPNHRYPTVADMARDIGNYLDVRPITARAPGRFYLAGRFVKRNKLLVAIAAISLLALLGLGRAAWEKERKEAARQSVESLNQLVEVIQWMPSAGFEDEGRELQILSHLEEELLRWPPGDILKARTHNTLGEFYLVFGRYDKAETHFQQAIDIASGSPGEYENIARYRYNLSQAWRRLGDFDKAREHARITLAYYDQNPNTSQADKARTMVNLAIALTGARHYEDAARLLEDAMPILSRSRGDHHEDTLLALSSYASVLHRQKRYQEAETAYRRVLEQGGIIYGAGQPFMLSARSNLATALVRLGKADEARDLYTETLAVRKLVLPADHESITNVMYNLGKLLVDLGSYTEAEGYLRQVLQRRAAEGAIRDELRTATKLAQCLDAMGNQSGAIACMQDALERCSTSNYRGDLALRTYNNLAGYLLKAGRGDEALTVATEAAKVEWPEFDSEVGLWSIKLNTARALEMTGKTDEAGQAYNKLLTGLEESGITSGNLAMEAHIFETLFRLKQGDVRAKAELRAWLPKLEKPDWAPLRQRLHAVLKK